MGVFTFYKGAGGVVNKEALIAPGALKSQIWLITHGANGITKMATRTNIWYAKKDKIPRAIMNRQR